MKKHTFLMKSLLAGAFVVGLSLTTPLTSSAYDYHGGHHNDHRPQHYNSHYGSNVGHGLYDFFAWSGGHGGHGNYRSHRNNRSHGNSRGHGNNRSHRNNRNSSH